MDPVSGRSPSEDRRTAYIATAVAILGTLLGVGAVMLWVGTGALLPPGPDSKPVAIAFVLVGGVGLGVLLGGARARTARALRTTVPHLFPFGSVPLDIALYLLVFAVVTCATHAFFDVFTGADNGGQVDGLANQNALSLILLGASVVVYLATMFAVALIARVVHLGRRIDEHRHLDPYRSGTAPSSSDVPWTPPNGPAAPASRFARPVLYLVSVAVAVGMSAATQLFEAYLQPASPGQWLASQAFTPVWALLTAGGLAYLDRGTRALETRYGSAIESRAEARSFARDTVP